MQRYNLSVNYDFYRCPLSLDVMRHPVIASDGFRYELCELLKVLKSINPVSPITRAKITSVIYDKNLKEALDVTIGESEDRYKNYNELPLLEEIKAYFTPPTSFWKKPATQSFLTGMVCYLAVIGTYTSLHADLDFYLDRETIIKKSFSIPLSILTFAFDYALRSMNNNSYGIFGSILQAPSCLFNYARNIISPQRDDRDPDQRRHHRLV